MAKVQRSNMVAKNDNGEIIRNAKKDKENPEIQKFYWWRADDDSMAYEIASTVKFISEHQQGRLEMLVAATRLYGTSASTSLLGTAFTRTQSNATSPWSQRISFNLCQSVVDTLQAKIAKNKVTPTFVTEGGVWGMQKKSRELSKFIEGCFYQNDTHRKGAFNFRDAAIWGTGILHVFRENDKIQTERVYPHEVFVDTIEALSTDPRQLHRVKIVDRDVLKAMFQDDEEAVEAIERAMPATYNDVGGMMTAADLVKVTESWHLPSGEDEDDGKHVICLEDKVLFKEDWTKNYFPFVFLNYSQNPFGFWGKGACERLQSLQGEINRLMILDQRSRWMMSSFKILVENGSKVVTQHLNNDVGTIIHYTGTPPQYVTPPPIDPSNAQQIDALIAKGFQQEGVSQLSATSLKPLGLDSGKALRAYNDIEADRQLFMQQEVERYYLEVARQMIEVAKDIYADRKTYVVTFPSGRFMESVDWADIKLEEDEYVLKAFPMSSLSDDLAGRLQEVQDLAQAGMISPRSARKLLRTPDLEMSDNLANAAEDLLCKIIEDMLDEGVYSPPEEYMDLTLARQLALEYMNYAKLQDCPEDRLDMLRDFITQIGDIQNSVLQAQMQQQMAAQQAATPPANPTPTPTSPLIPNVNQGVAA
jgi:hypothetical protein